MKVILTEDVYKHGVAGEVVDVANGFARNYLIPKGMAMKATPGALKQSARLRAEAEKRRERRDSELRELAERIEELTIAFPVKAGETGKLYGSVTTAHIAEAVEAEINMAIDHRRVGDQPLRQLGQHDVVVRLSSSLTPSVKVLVHREGEPPESVLDILPEEEIFEEEPSIFEEVIGEEELLDEEPLEDELLPEDELLEELPVDEVAESSDAESDDAPEPEAPEES
jgi:large subunit ribosomal protein L9